MKNRFCSILSITLLAGAAACGETDPETEVVDSVVLDSAPAESRSAVPAPPGAMDTIQIPVGIIVRGPSPYLGRPLVGRARVVEVVTDRGFWLEQDGSRIFAVIARTPQMEQAVNVNAGQTVAAVSYTHLTLPTKRIV